MAKPKAGRPSKRDASKRAFLFDLDGTLVDSVYQHTLAWREACEQRGIRLPNWFVHRQIGMSGGLLLHALLKEAGKKLGAGDIKAFEELHNRLFQKRISDIRPLPGAADLLKKLSRLQIPWAIATSGSREGSSPLIALLGLRGRQTIVTRDEVSRAKPDPDLFIVSARKLRTRPEDCIVVGDSVWDLFAAQRARALGVGLLSGGFGEEELMKAGAYRVYKDPGDLLDHIGELGVRGAE